ncbi:MAG: hypothetical protein AB8I08_18220 [Sandaracinaceae bacterium]
MLTCMAYVDLNPVRAGACKTLDEAEFTSIYARLKEASRRMDEARAQEPAPQAADEEGSTAPAGLAPFADQAAAEGDPSTLPMLFADYLHLLEWTGRAVRHGAGWLRGPEPAVMSRMGIEPEAWLRTMSSHGIQSLSALGSAEQLEALAVSREKKRVRGQGWARKMYSRAA